MTATALMQAIGQPVQIRMEKLVVNCTIQDIRHAWNRIDILIVPTSGSGKQWVALTRCVIAPELQRSLSTVLVTVE